MSLRPLLLVPEVVVPINRRVVMDLSERQTIAPSALKSKGAG